MTGRSVREPFRKRTRVGPRPAIYGSALEKSFREFSAAEASAKHHGNARTVHLAQIEPGILKGQRRSHQRPGRQAIQTLGLQAWHHIGGAKWLDQKCLPPARGLSRGDRFGFHCALRNQSSEGTVG